MTAIKNESLVRVYTSSAEADAAIVQEMLVSKGIHAVVSASEGPFAGSLVAPSEVLVWQSDEHRARALIQQAEVHHH